MINPYLTWFVVKLRVSAPDATDQRHDKISGEFSDPVGRKLYQVSIFACVSLFTSMYESIIVGRTYKFLDLVYT
jgi:hypothetical protein